MTERRFLVAGCWFLFAGAKDLFDCVERDDNFGITALVHYSGRWLWALELGIWEGWVAVAAAACSA